MTSIVPITFKKFSDRRWQRFTKMDFAANDMLAPLSAKEVPRAILSMAIGFIQEQGVYRLVALQGLESEKNLLLNKDDRWRGGYLPHHYFCHPFLMVANEDNTLVLCIDEDNELLTDNNNSSAEEFFIADKEPTKLVADIIEFLSGHAAELKSTQKICELLSQNRLIKPWPLRVKTKKGELSIEAFYCIDEERLNSVSATALKELRNGDALTTAYGQLFSMLNVNLLVRQINDNSEADHAEKALPREINFEDPESGGLINFDNL